MNIPVEMHDGQEVYEIAGAVEYLSYFGYMPELTQVSFTDGGDLNAEAITDLGTAVKQFQAMAGIDETGIIDRQTLKAMQWKRCGVSDAQALKLGEIMEAKWRKSPLAYFVDSYVGGLTAADQDHLIAQAWGSWMAVANLRLVKTTIRSDADIVISTGQGRAYQFDGPQGVLAWAELPSGTDQQLLMRFDLDERWLKQATQPGILFLNVAAHEFGHLLGLVHSRITAALMAPFYSTAINKPQANDDIPRIVSLYGAPVTPPTTPPTTPPSGNRKVVIEGQFVITDMPAA